MISMHHSLEISSLILFSLNAITRFNHTTQRRIAAVNILSSLDPNPAEFLQHDLDRLLKPQ